MPSVIGVGGVFFKCRDAKKLSDWYRHWLDIEIETDTNSASFLPRTMPEGGYTVLGFFKQETKYFDPSGKPYMINLVVDDLEGVLEKAGNGGAEIVGDIDEYDFGRFGWFIDPEDNKIELWEPRPVENFP